MTTWQEAQEMHAAAEQVWNASQVQQAISAMALKINTLYQDIEEILALVVMNGGLFTAASLLPQLRSAVHMDYIHASRYGQNTEGGVLTWHSKPKSTLTNVHILLIDDIFDEGYTLAAIHRFCQEAGAASVRSAVLTTKTHTRKVPNFHPDISGLMVPDRYVYGMGMDYKGFFRNLSAIYAVREA
jgi:hypoxanthine phosphoribosyltransferase